MRRAAARGAGGANDLPPNLAALWQVLYARDMSQREFAAKTGVTQACISQRNGRLLAHAREALAGIACYGALGPGNWGARPYSWKWRRSLG
jgi:hypothetical protein